MGLQRFPVSDFRGGLNTKDGAFALESNEAQDLMNVTLSLRGVLSQRAGKVRFDTSGFPAAKFAEHLKAWYPTVGTSFLIASCDGTIYSSTVGGVLTSRQVGTAASVWHLESMQNAAGAQRLWAANGVDPPRQFDSTLASSLWGGAPPTGSMMRVWKNRMVMSGVAAQPQRLYYSAIGDPETALGTNFIDIRSSDDDLDPITWLELIGDYLVVFKKQSVYVISDSNTFSFRRLGGPGCEDRFQSAQVKGRCYYFSRSGIWSIDGIRPPRMDSEKIENYITGNLNTAAIAKVRVAPTRDRRLMVALPFGASAVNNRLLEFIPDLVAVEDVTDPRGGAWSVHDLACSSLATFRASTTDEFYGGSTAVSKIHKLFTGTNDEGVAIASWWQGAWRPLISEEPFERIRRVNVEMSGQMTFELYQDFATGIRFSKFMIVPIPADSPWDGGTWDGGIWDATTAVALVRARPEKRGRYHSLRFQNSVLDKTFSIYAAEIALRGGKEHT